VVINENGVRKTVTKLEAAIKQLMNKAASGDLRLYSCWLAWCARAKNTQTRHPSQIHNLPKSIRRSSRDY
jgi:hypothetical protein